jgi:SAM-dependent methyltransferase
MEATRFGYEWEKYNKLFPEYEKQFLNWISPINPAFIKGKRVLDAGCGMGRNSYWCLKYGAKKVTAFDVDGRCIESSSKLMGNAPNFQVLRRSIYDIDFDSEFDFVFSIGVIHHLEDAEKAVRKLVRALKPGGKLLLWVYGYHRATLGIRIINTLRKVTSRLPLPLTHKISYIFSVPAFLFIKIFRPSGKYFRQLATFRFTHLHSIVFDQLLPEIGNYYKRQDAERLVSQLKDVRIYCKNDNSWTIIGTRGAKA